MSETIEIGKLIQALEDQTWQYLRVLDDGGEEHDLSRLETIDYLATLCPELLLPPSAMH